MFIVFSQPYELFEEKQTTTDDRSPVLYLLCSLWYMSKFFSNLEYSGYEGEIKGCFLKDSLNAHYGLDYQCCEQTL